MIVAALYDIHGNIAALDAVLADVRLERVDAVVVGGDVAWGPFPAETVERLMGLDGTVRLVRGNCDREMVEAFDAGASAGSVADAAAESVAAWAAERLTRVQRDFLASFEPTATLDVEGLGRTLFCHATPSSDEARFTRLTPAAEVADLLGDVEAGVVVCGHTHMQFERRVGPTRVVNAGSVGFAVRERNRARTGRFSGRRWRSAERATISTGPRRPFGRAASRCRGSPRRTSSPSLRPPRSSRSSSVYVSRAATPRMIDL